MEMAVLQVVKSNMGGVVQEERVGNLTLVYTQYHPNSILRKLQVMGI